MKTFGERSTEWAILLLIVITLVALYTPIVIVVLGAFYLDNNANFDFSHATLGYFEKLSANQLLLDSV